MNTRLIGISLVVVLLLGVAALTGCAQQSKPSTTGQTGQTQQTPATETGGQQTQTPPAAKTYDVAIQGFAFNPSELNIKKGDTVTWTNKDSAPHTVASDSGEELASGTLSSDQAYSHTFNQAGNFSYHCGIHLSMKAKVVVS